MQNKKTSFLIYYVENIDIDIDKSINKDIDKNINKKQANRQIKAIKSYFIYRLKIEKHKYLLILD